MSKHTPTPWGFGRTGDEQRIILGNSGTGRYVCNVQIHQTPRAMGAFDEAEREANAAFIVRAVNAHDELVAALKTASMWTTPLITREALDQIQDALAKADPTQ